MMISNLRKNNSRGFANYMFFEDTFDLQVLVFAVKSSIYELIHGMNT